MQDFVDFFAALMPPGFLKAYGIIGDAPSPELPFGGCGGGATPFPACDTECYEPGWGPKSGAEAGIRYHEAIAALGGTDLLDLRVRGRVRPVHSRAARQ